MNIPLLKEANIDKSNTSLESKFFHNLTFICSDKSNHVI